MPNARLVGHAGRVESLPPTHPSLGCHLCGVVILRATSGSRCADEPRPARPCFKSGMVSSMSLSSLDFPATHAEVSQARVVIMDAAQDLVQHSLVSGGQVNNDRLSSSAGNFRSCRVPLPLALAVSGALVGVGRESSAPYGRVFFGWWPRNEAHFLRYALWAARTLHPHPRLSVTGLFKPPTPADRLVFSTLVRLTRAQRSHPRRQHGSWLPVFDHESAHRCRADRVSRTPEVLPSMLDRPLCCHQQRGRIRHLDQFLHPGSRLPSQKVIVHLPHELVPVRRLPLVCHASDCSCGKKARSVTRWSRESAKRREPSTQTLWSFGSNSASTF